MSAEIPDNPYHVRIIRRVESIFEMDRWIIEDGNKSRFRMSSGKIDGQEAGVIEVLEPNKHLVGVSIGSNLSSQDTYSYHPYTNRLSHQIISLPDPEVPDAADAELTETNLDRVIDGFNLLAEELNEEEEMGLHECDMSDWEEFVRRLESYQPTRINNG